ncbi:MAG: phosphoribosylanthranilate isomerase [Candidatus Omnitrophota bacterium]|nr:phosphoribosylanthranilate isomerase [Candidatus Omnitrophota bacterium]
MTRIKICGITNLNDALAAVKFGANALGFVFYKKSPRYISPKKAKKIIQSLPVFISSVGVFVNEKEKQVKRIAQFCGLSYLQFHGSETAKYCGRFNGYKIIKAFRIKDIHSFKNIRNFKKVKAYLFDAFDKKSFGGTGKAFNWDLLKPYLKLKKPIILSGGLNIRNIQEAIKKFSPYALDLSSGVEISCGKKNPKLLKQIFRQIYKKPTYQ